MRNQFSDTYTRETVYKCCLHDGVFDFGELRVDLVHEKRRDASLRNQLSDTYTRETVYKCCLHDGVFDFGELRVDLVHEKKEGCKFEKSTFGYLHA